MLFNGKSAAKRTYCVYIMGFESIFIQWDFPGGPVAKTLHSQSRGPWLEPWSCK